MTEWSEFTARLADQLAELSTGTVLKIIETERSRRRFSGTGIERYAQFRQSDELLRAELVGDEWLDPAAAAGAAGERVLTTAGWQQPDPADGVNWWIEWAWPLSSARYRELASMVVLGMRDVFRIAEPSDLVYEAWNDRQGDQDLELPRLGPAGV